MNGSTTTDKFYHERQSKMLCCLHALNNLLQDRIFSKQSLDDIADGLNSNKLINPHRNVFGLGNYDANVLVIALQQCGYDIVWCDKRKTLQDHKLNLDNILGFILNTLSQRHVLHVPLPYAGSHWISYRRLSHGDEKPQYYNLDSKFPRPKAVASSDKQFLTYLEGKLREFPDTQLLFVVSQKVLQERTWTLAR